MGWALIAIPPLIYFCLDRKKTKKEVKHGYNLAKENNGKEEIGEKIKEQSSRLIRCILTYLRDFSKLRK